MGLNNQVALVTGSSRGIGRAIAIKLAAEGAKVAINYAGNVKAAEEVKEIIEANGGEAMLVQADVGNFESCSQMVAAIEKEWGSIDILVNNAGITKDNLLMRLNVDDWDAVINTNLKSVFNLAKLCSKQMLKKRAGRIINLTSVVGIIGNAGQTNYAASKAGVIGFTKSLAKELASRGITVNAVAPGYIDTDMTAEISDAAKEATLKSIPLGKMGKPEDIANAVNFLASPAAQYITGQVLNVDGGMVM